MKLPRHLDRAFQRLGAGIGEEHRIGKGRLGEPFGQPFALRDAVEIGGMPQTPGLPGQRFDQMGMGMAEAVHRHAGAEVEEFLACRGDEACALAPLEGKVAAGIGGQKRRDHGGQTPKNQKCRQPAAASKGLLLAL